MKMLSNMSILTQHHWNRHEKHVFKPLNFRFYFLPILKYTPKIPLRFFDGMKIKMSKIKLKKLLADHFCTSDSKILDFEILEFSSIFSQILASTRVLEMKWKSGKTKNHYYINHLEFLKHVSVLTLLIFKLKVLDKNTIGLFK